ncbi:MAG: hypothetical protein H7281_16450 [Bacteriovorax sp.]|nr:hypothetical protein [Bacteriovorax sp.]
MRFLIFCILCIFSSFNLEAAVWNDNQTWSLHYEEEFSKWMSSGNVHEYMFVDPNGPYYGINADCADSAYALRAIFSFEHKLPFVIHEPTSKIFLFETINNRQNKWDNAGDEKGRLIAMINEIGTSTGTEDLSFYDTYPVSIKGITAGAIFMTQTALESGHLVRHTYNIKKINPTGSFDVLYSSENIEKNNTPMIRRKDIDFDILPVSPYGFRKFRWPDQLGKDINKFPLELKASNEQYDLAAKLGKDGFFNLVKKTISTVEETGEEKIRRAFNTVCLESKERIIVVNQAQQRLKEIGNTCMDYKDFDIYSTPSRDISLRESFFSFERIYFELKKMRKLKSLSSEMLKFAEIIFQNKINSDQDLLKACPINYSEGKVVDLAALWERIYFEKITSHPNDIINVRWGEVLSPRTKCKIWY